MYTTRQETALTSSEGYKVTAMPWEVRASPAPLSRVRGTSFRNRVTGCRLHQPSGTRHSDCDCDYSLSVFSPSPILPSRYLHEYLLVPTYLPKVVIGHRTISPCMIEVLVGFEPNLLYYFSPPRVDAPKNRHARPTFEDLHPYLVYLPTGMSSDSARPLYLASKLEARINKTQVVLLSVERHPD